MRIGVGSPCRSTSGAIDRMRPVDLACSLKWTPKVGPFDRICRWSLPLGFLFQAAVAWLWCCGCGPVGNAVALSTCPRSAGTSQGGLTTAPECHRRVEARRVVRALLVVETHSFADPSSGFAAISTAHEQRRNIYAHEGDFFSDSFATTRKSHLK